MQICHFHTHTLYWPSSAFDHKPMSFAATDLESYFFFERLNKFSILFCDTILHVLTLFVSTIVDLPKIQKQDF